MHNRGYYTMKYDMNEFKKINKECCLICSILSVFHLSYLGFILYIFKINDPDNSTS